MTSWELAVHDAIEANRTAGRKIAHVRSVRHGRTVGYTVCTCSPTGAVTLVPGVRVALDRFRAPDRRAMRGASVSA